MPFNTALTQRFGLDYPIIGAPMSGATTPELVAAVSNAGALGFFAAAYLQPAEIRAAAERIRSLTTRPFGVNLFAPTAVPPIGDTTAALRVVARAHEALGIEPPSAPAGSGLDFDEQLEAVLDMGAAAFSFTFGIPAASALDSVRARGMWVIGTATTVDEAVALEHAGVDAVVAQGSEAGAHRGTFLGEPSMAMVGTIALVPQTVDAVRVPVIASGGIADSRGLTAALALGAQGAQIGTAFLASHESGISEAYKDVILAAPDNATRVTRAFSGRAARGIVNTFMQDAEDADAILPFPFQNVLTRPMRNAAGKQGRTEYLSLFAGQATRLVRREGAADIVRRIGGEGREERGEGSKSAG
jgi:nitronate monooxygenase